MKNLLFVAIMLLAYGCHAQKKLVKTVPSTDFSFTCSSCDTVIYKQSTGSRAIIEVTISSNLNPNKKHILDVLHQQGRYNFYNAGGLDISSIVFELDQREIFVKNGKSDIQLEEKIKAVVWVPGKEDILVSK